MDSSTSKMEVHVIGGGLAGCEAAWQCLAQGLNVRMFEMRPHKYSPAHKTSALAELVCSNSLKSTNHETASGYLKYEMEKMGSLLLQVAHKCSVPAGDALAVDRAEFSRLVEDTLLNHPNFVLDKKEFIHFPDSDRERVIYIIATGPLSSDGILQSIQNICQCTKSLNFYDAIAPTLNAETIDTQGHFWANRWGREGKDYLNIPLNEEQYFTLVRAIDQSEKTPLREFEEQKYFESCLPIEVMVERGENTLRFGPMKPVGLIDPKTGLQPFAVVQLRKENNEGTALSMVGFQTKMKQNEQKKVFRLLPGFENVEFFRFGSIHRNTFLNSPLILSADLSFKNDSGIIVSGQLTGVEGYLESAALGIIAGRVAAGKLRGCPFTPPPSTTLMGALLKHVTHENPGVSFSPMNSNLGILPAIDKRRGESKGQRKARQIAIAKAEFDNYFKKIEA